jgi:hypothetical protein
MNADNFSEGGKSQEDSSQGIQKEAQTFRHLDLSPVKTTADF